VHRDKPLDHATRILAIIGWSLPSFWFGIVLLAIFWGAFGLLPAGRLSTQATTYIDLSPSWVTYTGMMTIDGLLNGQLWITIDALKHLILPSVVLVTIQIALIIRLMRSSMLEALNRPYVIMARAKGLAQGEVINKHARRNALIPAITMSGLLVAGMLNGLVITETVFLIPGLGNWAATSAIRLDVPAVLGFALFAGVLFVLSNLIVDVLYAYIDPRIRLD
jgi:peptide/nickel transport system permease protein